MSRGRQAVRDAGLALQVSAALAVSWAVPMPLWRPLTSLIGRIVTSGRLFRPHAGDSRFDEVVAARLGCSPRDLAVERVATGYLSRLLGLRCYRPWRRHVPVVVDGREHLTNAINAGTGAVLWIGSSTFGSIVTKIGLSTAGWQVTHLSRPAHGFGDSPFAVRHLNPIWTRIEARFLHERLVMAPGTEPGALRTLRRRLAENRLVSITVGAEGARTVGASLMGREWRVATGPVSLAAASGAPLLPVFAIRDAEGRFRVTVEPPLRVAESETRDARESSVAREYAARLEPWLLRFPGQWLV
jgi:hypothetical protein